MTHQVWPHASAILKLASATGRQKVTDKYIWNQFAQPRMGMSVFEK
ncbi:hypothetical protein GYL69_003506 [Vibrio vulnificus]|nr:hypothetical protein [Vibrio vulnificus]